MTPRSIAIEKTRYCTSWSGQRRERELRGICSPLAEIMWSEIERESDLVFWRWRSEIAGAFYCLPSYSVFARCLAYRARRRRLRIAAQQRGQALVWRP